MIWVLNNNEELARSGRTSRQKAPPEPRPRDANTHGILRNHPAVCWGEGASLESRAVHWEGP